MDVQEIYQIEPCLLSKIYRKIFYWATVSVEHWQCHFASDEHYEVISEAIVYTMRF